jgi:hypothetical protein
MRKITVCLLAAIWFIYPGPSIGNGESDLCAHTDQPLACLKANFEKLYSGNYLRFWKILREGAAEAERCEAVEKTTTFLELANLRTNNAEFNEFLNEVIEHLATERTDCFLAATCRANAVTQERVIERLRHPLYINVTVIDNALRRKIDGDYRSLINLYFHGKR